MNKKFGKSIVVGALALSIISACTAGPMALGFSGKQSIKSAAKEYANSIEALVEATGDSYENNAESYPDNAVGNPDAPAEYVETSIDLGNGFLSGVFSLTRSFLSK